MSDDLLPDLLAAVEQVNAWRLSFDHPITGMRHSFEAPIPVEFRPWTEGVALFGPK